MKKLIYLYLLLCPLFLSAQGNSFDVDVYVSSDSLEQAPLLVDYFPKDGSIVQSLSFKFLFSKEMDTESFKDENNFGFYIDRGDYQEKITGFFTFDSCSVTFEPMLGCLPNNTHMIIKLNGVKSLDGISMEDKYEFNYGTRGWTSIIDVYEENALLYPNPASQILMLPDCSGNVKIEVYDYHWNKADDKAYTGITGALEYNCGSLNAGVYYIYATSGGKIKKYRFIKD
jgi:hypothetical protein